MRRQRITRDRFDAADPAHLDPLESINAAYGFGFLLGVGVPYSELEQLAAPFRITIRRAAWADQWRKGIGAGKDARKLSRDIAPRLEASAPI